VRAQKQKEKHSKRNQKENTRKREREKKKQVAPAKGVKFALFESCVKAVAQNPERPTTAESLLVSCAVAGASTQRTADASQCIYETPQKAKKKNITEDPVDGRWRTFCT
jgi:hypothetical protein